MREPIFKLAFALLFLIGCEEKKKVGMELKIHIPEVKINLDPHKMEDAFSMLIVSQLHRGLLRFDSQGTIVADLAESWSESKDKLKYKFKLRKRSFSNGKIITSKNVQMSFARLFYLESGIAADIDYIKGASEFYKTKDISKLGIKIISDSEVEFELSQPSALFLKHIAVADCAILPIENFNDELVLTSKGGFSGPYKVVSTIGQRIFNLEKWRSDELDSSNPPARVKIFTSSEDPFKLALLGETDSLDRNYFTELQRNKLQSLGWESVPTEITAETFVILNPSAIPLEARRYLYSKTDANEVSKLIGGKSFTAAFGLIPIGFSGVLLESDIANLKQASQGLYKGAKVSFKLDFEENNEFEKKTAEHLQKIWTTPLIEIKLNPLIKSEKLQRMFSKQSEAIIGRKGVDYPDGFSVLTYFKGKYSANYFHVNDQAIDQSITESLKEFDQAKRDQLYKNIQLQILKHYTNIPLLFGSPSSGLWSKSVKSVPSHPMGFHTMQLETIEMRAN